MDLSSVRYDLARRMVAVSVALQLLFGVTCRAGEESIAGGEEPAAVQADTSPHHEADGHSGRHSPGSHGGHAECPESASFLIGTSGGLPPSPRQGRHSSAPDEAPPSPDYDVPAPIPIA
jgi:hypothetical protein